MSLELWVTSHDHDETHVFDNFEGLIENYF